MLAITMNDNPNIKTPVVTIVPTEPKHIAQLKKNLRPEDAAEILRLGVSVQHALWFSYKNSLIRKTALIDGKPVAIFGCSGTFLGKAGVPFLLTTPDVKKISPLRFCRIYQEEVINMLKLFPYLENYCDAKYTSALRLLEIIGFKIDSPVGIVKNENLFCKFYIGSK